MHSSHRRHVPPTGRRIAQGSRVAGVRTGLLLAVTLAAVAALLAACSAQATMGSTPSGSDAASTASAEATAAQSGAGNEATAGAKATSGKDWTRVLNILAFMKAETPTKPVVVLLGGSAARESTIDDGSWREQIVAKGGVETLAWNMGSRNRTMAQNIAIVKALTKVPTIVYIGVNLGSFTSSQKTATIKVPAAAPSEDIDLEQPHQYSAKKKILSAANKTMFVDQWLQDRYPVFKRNFSTSASVLEKLIKVCTARGFHPVLLELPRNTAIIGTKLDAPTKKYRDKCKALAKKHDVPWVSFVAQAKLPNKSFYDLWHLVEPGRRVWQKLLSAKTAVLLEDYGLDGGGS